MKLFLVIATGLVIAAAALSLAVFGSAASGGESGGKPALKLVRGAPLTLRGTRFVSGERVRVSASSGRTSTRRVNANGSGLFVVRFPFGYDRCNGLLVTAVGSDGSRATLKRPELLCPPRL
jgi:hypothetical protein